MSATLHFVNLRQIIFAFLLTKQNIYEKNIEKHCLAFSVS
jgi:hypothetical protein